MESDAFFQKEYENLNDAILQAIISSQKVQKILGKLKEEENIDEMAVLNLFFSLDELYEMISENQANSMIYKLEPSESQQSQEEEKVAKNSPLTENKVNRIDGRTLSRNETLFENFCQGKFKEEAWLKKARIRL